MTKIERRILENQKVIMDCLYSEIIKKEKNSEPTSNFLELSSAVFSTQKLLYEDACWIEYYSLNQIPSSVTKHIKCSNCGQYWSMSENAKTFKYCFNCGAKMNNENV